MKIEIDIDNEYSFEGVDYIVTGEYRIPEPGEYYMNLNSPYAYRETSKGNTKRIILKLKRWRAETGGTYYYLDDEFKCNKCTDNYYQNDNKRFRAKNYFRTDEECLMAANSIKNLLKENNSGN